MSRLARLRRKAGSRPSIFVKITGRLVKLACGMMGGKLHTMSFLRSQSGSSRLLPLLYGSGMCSCFISTAIIGVLLDASTQHGLANKSIWSVVVKRITTWRLDDKVMGLNHLTWGQPPHLTSFCRPQPLSWRIRYTVVLLIREVIDER